MDAFFNYFSHIPDILKKYSNCRGLFEYDKIFYLKVKVKN